MQNGDPTVSYIEDLDPDSTPHKGRADRRELLLGSLLLALVVGWAGWQWWQQDGKERSYRLGELAEQEYRWAEARSDYSAASGYRDAESRAARVSELINQLQDNFVSARWYAQGGDWAATLRAVQALYAIDPHYGDATSLEVEASRHVYNDALQGAIAVRPQAQPPGLYYRAENGWVWLEGSDQWSSVRSLLSSGMLVYDVPVTGERLPIQPPVAPAPAPSLDARQGADWLNSRRITAASFDGDTLRFTHLTFNSAIYDFYVAGGRGVWAVRREVAGAGEQTPPGRPALRDNLSFPAGRAVDYQSLGNTVIAPVSVPGREWVVLNADLERDRLLLADVKEQRDESAIIDLYLSDATGGNRRFIYSHDGALGSTQFSPDGRYVLVSTFSSLGGWQTEKQSLVLLDLEPGAQPVTLSAKVVAAGALGSSPLPQMRATFLTRGAVPDMVLVAEWGAEHGRLSLFDPASPAAPVTRAEIAGSLAGKAWVNEEDDGTGLVVAWQPWLSAFSPRSATLVVARLAPGKSAATEMFTLDKESEPVSVVMRGDSLICVAYQAGESRNAPELTIYNLPLSGPGNERAPVIKVYSTTVLDAANPYLAGFAWQLGPRLLGYTGNGQLHARTYDGVIDVPLESGVTSFFNFDWASPTHLLR
jgi:hypothetical protein